MRTAAYGPFGRKPEGDFFPSEKTDLVDPHFLKTRANGWPELEVGGPGFCFPVLRWTGKAYASHCQHYEGKPCRR